MMTRPVTVDPELSHLSEENRWGGSYTEEYVKTLEAEVERLREELSAQKVITESYMSECDRYKELAGERLETLADVEQEHDQLKSQVNGMKQALNDLVCNSEGVAGLHKNGDVAPWDELLIGGRFDEWLAVFDDDPQQCLAAHDVDVIIRAINECAYKTLEGDIINVECIREYANQLCRQANGVLS